MAANLTMEDVYNESLLTDLYRFCFKNTVRKATQVDERHISGMAGCFARLTQAYRVVAPAHFKLHPLEGEPEAEETEAKEESEEAPANEDSE